MYVCMNVYAYTYLWVKQRQSACEAKWKGAEVMVVIDVNMYAYTRSWIKIIYFNKITTHYCTKFQIVVEVATVFIIKFAWLINYALTWIGFYIKWHRGKHVRCSITQAIANWRKNRIKKYLLLKQQHYFLIFCYKLSSYFAFSYFITLQLQHVRCSVR